jgi:superfamily II DNA or RNA helicase
MPPLFTYDLLRRHVSQTFLEQGLRYVQAGRVADLRAGRGSVTGSVSGGRGRPFHAEIRLRTGGGEPLLDTLCTCPRGDACKHVAAVGLAYLEGDPGVAELRRVTGDAEAARRFQGWERALTAAVEAEEVPFSPPSWPAPEPGGAPTAPLRYLLEPQPGGLALQLLRRAPAEGGYRPYPFGRLRQLPPTALDPLDHYLLTALGLFTPRGPGLRLDLTPAQGGWLITKVLATDRLRFRSGEGPAAVAGPPRLFGVELAEADDGFRFRLTAPPAGLTAVPVPEWPCASPLVAGSDDYQATTALPVTPLLYLNERTGEVGPLTTPVPPAALCHLMASPALTAAEAQHFTSRWGRRCWRAAGRFPEPVPDTTPWVDAEPPTPCLGLVEVASDRPGEIIPQVEGHLAFRYGDAAAVPYGTPHVPRTVRDGIAVRLRRDRGVEEEAAGRLRMSGWSVERDAAGAPIMIQREIADHVAFHRTVLPELVEEGWQVDEVLSTLRVSDADVEVRGEIAAEKDGFAMDLAIGIGDERLDMTPLLQGYLEGEKVGRTRGGELFLLPTAQFDRVLALLEELGESDVSRPLHLARYHALQLEELEATANLAVDDSWRYLATGLRDFQRLVPVVPPRGLHAELRPYQHEGLTWLSFLRETGLHGILADDMGLGKTVQALALLLLEKEAGRLDRPALVVVPTSLVFNWEAEARRFAPDLTVLPLHGTARKRRFDEIEGADLILTTYGLLRWDKELLIKQPFHYVILDEAQAIKNERTQVARLVRLLQARHRLTMTGTPMENHLGELWSQFAFLMPGFLGTRKRFNDLFRRPIERASDPEGERPSTARENLARRIRPFILRRTKAQVAVELPAKSEIPLYSELAGAQRELYETVRLAYLEKVRREVETQGIQRSQITILDALLRLRQVCCHPRLVKLSVAQGIDKSVKMDQLGALVPEAVEEGRRILIFSQFVQFLAIVRGWCEERGLDFAYLDGTTSNRKEVVEAFQEGQTPLFLISLRAGGAGLNLTAADTVIHLDPWWNPAVMDQATDRAHRIGQDKPVEVYNLITRGTVEEKILTLQERKQRLADDILTTTREGGHEITREDLEVLFEPLA